MAPAAWRDPRQHHVGEIDERGLRSGGSIILNEVSETPTPWYSRVSADLQVKTTDTVILVEQNHTRI